MQGDASPWLWQCRLLSYIRYDTIRYEYIREVNALISKLSKRSGLAQISKEVRDEIVKWRLEQHLQVTIATSNFKWAASLGCAARGPLPVRPASVISGHQAMTGQFTSRKPRLSNSLCYLWPQCSQTTEWTCLLTIRQSSHHGRERVVARKVLGSRDQALTRVIKSIFDIPIIPVTVPL